MSPFSREVISAFVGGTSLLGALAIFDVLRQPLGGREVAWVVLLSLVTVAGLVATAGLLWRRRWAAVAVAWWSGAAVLMTIGARSLGANGAPWLVVAAFVVVMVLLSVKIVHAVRRYTY